MKNKCPCEECLVLTMCRERAKHKIFTIVGLDCDIITLWVFDFDTVPMEKGSLSNWKICKNIMRGSKKDDHPMPM